MFDYIHFGSALICITYTCSVPSLAESVAVFDKFIKGMEAGEWKGKILEHSDAQMEF